MYQQKKGRHSFRNLPDRKQESIKYAVGRFIAKPAISRKNGVTVSGIYRTENKDQ